jgi:hypothetical protein
MKDSKLYSLNAKDILRGLVIAVLTPAFVVVQMSIDKGTLIMDWKAIGMAAVAGGVGYLLKNFLTPAKEETK